MARRHTVCRDTLEMIFAKNQSDFFTLQPVCFLQFNRKRICCGGQHDLLLHHCAHGRPHNSGCIARNIKKKSVRAQRLILRNYHNAIHKCAYFFISIKNQFTTMCRQRIVSDFDVPKTCDCAVQHEKRVSLDEQTISVFYDKKRTVLFRFNETRILANVKFF